MVLANHAIGYPLDPSIGGTLLPVYRGMSEVAARLWMGVPIFFVISGYCISAAADSQRRKTSGASRYFVRRFRRIFPPYWIVLAATAAIVGAGDILLDGAIVQDSPLLRPWWFSASQWFGSISLTEIWRFHLFGSQKALYLGHAWTLCYEEQFYAVCGALLIFFPRRFFAAAMTVTVAVVGIALVGEAGQWAIDGFFFDGAWLQFAFGVELYRVINYGTPAQRRWSLTFFVSTWLGTLLFGSALLDPNKNQPQQLFVAAGFAALALALHPYDSRLMSSRGLSPIRRCGLMCYSLYLIHLPLIGVLHASLLACGIPRSVLVPVVTLPLYGAVSIAVSWWFHLLVEKRFMNGPADTRTMPVSPAIAMTPAPS
jgi:peptidoglycan/LPS O-acetylase OafA/YrhL